MAEVGLGPVDDVLVCFWGCVLLCGCESGNVGGVVVRSGAELHM